MDRNENRQQLKRVYEILKKKGYDPINQVEGYLITGDPTYITSAEGARKMVAGMENETVLREVVEYYFAKN